MKQFYKIGEISKLYQIGPDSLRYYEELGLLNPCLLYTSNPCYASRILGSQCCNCTHGIYAICNHRFYICLNSGASAGITCLLYTSKSSPHWSFRLQMHLLL